KPNGERSGHGVLTEGSGSAPQDNKKEAGRRSAPLHAVHSVNRDPSDPAGGASRRAVLRPSGRRPSGDGRGPSSSGQAPRHDARAPTASSPAPRRSRLAAPARLRRSAPAGACRSTG